MYSLLGVLIPVITIPYVSRVLLSEGVGQVSYAQNIVSYFVLFASLGIPNYGIREIAKNNKTIEERSKVFYEIFSINLIATFFASISYYIVVYSFSYFWDKQLIYCIVGITLILNAFNIDWFYKGIEEFRYITIRSYIVKLLSLIAIFVLVRNRTDVWLYALISALATSANYIFNIIHVRSYICCNKAKLDLVKHLKSIFFMFATAIAVELYAQLDTTMIGILNGDKFVGYYSNSIRLTKIVSVVISAIGSVLLPRFSVYYSEGKIGELKRLVEKSIDYILFISVPCSLGLIIVSDDLVNTLFGADFLPAITTLRILAPLIPILAVGNIFGTQLMIVFGHEKKLTITVIIGAISNLCLNSYLIPKYQQNGAALASVFAELLVMILQIVLTKRIITVNVNYKHIIKLLIQALVMICLVLVIRLFAFQYILRLVLSLIMGCMGYFFVSYLLKNELLMELINKFKFLGVRSK